MKSLMQSSENLSVKNGEFRCWWSAITSPYETNGTREAQNHTSIKRFYQKFYSEVLDNAIGSIKQQCKQKNFKKNLKQLILKSIRQKNYQEE